MFRRPRRAPASPSTPVRLTEIDLTEMTELVLDAWRMVVPKKVFAAYERRQEL